MTKFSMMRASKAVGAAGAILLVAAFMQPSSAAAADFTFEIPVELNRLPTVTGFAVSCGVSRVALGEPYPFGAGNVVGRGETAHALSGGSFSGVVAVTVNANGLVPANEGRSYSCSIRISGTARTGTTYTANPGNMESVYSTATGQTLVTVVASVSGEIAR